MFKIEITRYNFFVILYFRSSVPARTQQRAPAPQPHPTQVAPAQPQQPGLFAQMAATAGGVAVGSAIVRLYWHNILKYAY